MIKPFLKEPRAARLRVLRTGLKDKPGRSSFQGTAREAMRVSSQWEAPEGEEYWAQPKWETSTQPGRTEPSWA